MDLIFRAPHQVRLGPRRSGRPHTTGTFLVASTVGKVKSPMPGRFGDLGTGLVRSAMSVKTIITIM